METRRSSSRVHSVRAIVAVSLAAGVAVVGASTVVAQSPNPFATKRHFWAWVYLDRGTPDRGVPVYDFRVNESPMAQGGVQHLVLYSPDGTFSFPFEVISEVTVSRTLGQANETARYDATVTLKDGREARRGRLELISMRGTVDLSPWHVILTARDDRGANLYRIVFVDPPAEEE